MTVKDTTEADDGPDDSADDETVGMDEEATETVEKAATEVTAEVGGATIELEGIATEVEGTATELEETALEAEGATTGPEDVADESADEGLLDAVDTGTRVKLDEEDDAVEAGAGAANEAES